MRLPYSMNHEVLLHRSHLYIIAVACTTHAYNENGGIFLVGKVLSREVRCILKPIANLRNCFLIQVVFVWKSYAQCFGDGCTWSK